MTRRTARRISAAAAACAAVAGVSGFAAGSAGASTEPQLCKDAEVRATASPAPDSPSGHHALVLHYTAADASTHCTVNGAPYGMTFYDGAGAPLGVNSSVAPGGNPADVTIDPAHSATSYVLIPNGPEPGPAPAAGLRFHLPSDASNTPVGVALPNTELTGDPQFTDLVQDS